jgi:YQGE family putative transporter
MLPMLLRSLTAERERYRTLSQSARSLLISTVAFGVASPLLVMFTNTFIWRLNQDLISIATYNGAWMLGLSVAFVFNGWLLGNVKLSWLYALGLVVQSAACLLLFQLEIVRLGGIAAFGIASGLAAGIYWANRNVLTLQVTKGPLRDYFCCLESALGTILSVLSPLVLGCFLELGVGAVGLSVVERYRVLAFMSLGIQLVGAWYIVRAQFETYVPKSIFVRNASTLWNRARAFTAIKGVAEGSTMFIPTLIVLRLVGQEGAVGLTQSSAMVFTSIVLYVIAARIHLENRRRMLQIAVGSMIAGGLIQACAYSQLGALSYIFLQTLAIQLLWVAANPIILDAINSDQENDDEHYCYIVDRELCLNLGRLAGVFLVLMLCVFGDADLTLRIVPLIFGLIISSLLVVSRGLGVR